MDEVRVRMDEVRVRTSHYEDTTKIRLRPVSTGDVGDARTGFIITVNTVSTQCWIVYLRDRTYCLAVVVRTSHS